MTTSIIERIQGGSLVFSLLSVITCIIIVILIFFQKQLRSITYTFLMFIFMSEIANCVGNIILDTMKFDLTTAISEDELQTYKNKNLAALCIISFTDIFTNSLFVFFTYCSIKLIKETNKLIKKKVPRFIIGSAIFSIIYMVAFLVVGIHSEDQIRIDARFRGFYKKDDAELFKIDYFVLSSVHIFLIILFSVFSVRNTWVVLSFMSEKQKMDKANAKNIAKLIKILRRYPIVCVLYWLFLIPRIICVALSNNQNILRDSLYLVSESLFRLRGFLIFLNTFRSSKIQNIIYRIIEVNIKHNCLLNLKICRRKRRHSKIKSRTESLTKNLEY